MIDGTRPHPDALNLLHEAPPHASGAHRHRAVPDLPGPTSWVSRAMALNGVWTMRLARGASEIRIVGKLRTLIVYRGKLTRYRMGLQASRQQRL